MARRKLKVMISSRCNDIFPAAGGEGSTTLSEIRLRLKRELEGEKFLGSPLLEVWINEDEPPEPGTKDSWDVCIEAARQSDILLVLYNGNAGWAATDQAVGICHAELMTAFNESPGKVSLISILPQVDKLRPSGPRDKQFQNFVNRTNLFRGAEPQTQDELVREVKKALVQSILGLTAKGAAETKKSRYNSGPALDWARLDFKSRHDAMVKELSSAISTKSDVAGQVVAAPFGDKKSLFKISAIPAALTVTAAREMAGQPFLADHASVSYLSSNVAGPVHVIACHRTVSEAQAQSMLGFPDATVVSGAFGVYVADNIQKIQILFLANCRDASSIRHNWQRLVDWLTETGEAELLVQRAQARARIVKAIAKEAA